METNYKEIEFKPYDPAHNDINCEDGELEGASGMPSIGMDVKFTIEGGKLIAIHQDRAIVYHQGRLMWALPGDDAHIAGDDLMDMAEMPEPASVAIMGDMLVTTGRDGLLYHHWRGAGYVTLPQLPPLPKIEFGLLKVGEMATTCSLTVPVSMIPDPGGNGMTDPHPSANTGGSEDVSGDIDRSVDTLIRRAHDDKRARGYFTTLFFVRYAVRDHDGNCLCVSPPVLMAGSVLPPAIEVLSTTQDEKNATLRLRLSGSAYFSLLARACPLPPEWLPVVAGIDIYVSPQLSTRASSAGYLCSYSNVLGQVNGGSGHRGRDNPDSSDDTMFSGHYSDDGINYTDHFTDSALRQTQVWYVSPNVGLAAEIAEERRFFRIASLSPAALNDMTSFRPVPVETTVTSSLESLESLPDEPGSAAIVPDVLATLNGRLVAAGGSRSIVKPADPSVAAAFSGNVSSAASVPVVVRVFTRVSGGELRCVSASYDSDFSISSSFPRYIYHPDGAAEMMLIERGGARYCLPLSRHPFMSGSFWFGGLGKDYAPVPDTEPAPEATESDRIHSDDRIWLSSPGSARHFPMSQSIAACNSRVMAVSTSVVTPDITAIGRYPVYIFAGDGVWLLEYDSDRLRLCGSHRISGEVCASAAAIAPTGEGVAFATDRSLLLLSGSKIKRLLSLRSLPMQPSHIIDCIEGGVEKTASTTSPVITPALAYDGATSTLIVADTTSGTTCLIDMASCTAALWCRNTRSLPLTSGRPLICTQSHEAGYLSPSADTAGMILTRPIKLTKAFTPKIIRSVTIWHDGSPDSIVLKVYGANSLRGWHLIASSGCHRAELPSRSRWRFLRLVIEPKVSCRIYGAQISYEC